jgi:O-antigen/teichoic acid export membrane protein
VRRLTTNFLSLAASEVARKVLGFLSVAYLARRLTVADFGLVSLGFTILSYTINISTAGLNLFGVKQVARGVDDTFTGRLIALRLFSAAVVFVLTALVAILVVHESLTVKLIVLFSCSLFAHALMLEWFYLGKEEMYVVSVGKSVTAAVYLILLLFLVRTDGDILLVAVAAVAGDFAMMLFYNIKYKRDGGVLQPVLDFSASKQMLRQALPLGTGTVLGQISVNLAPLALAILMTNVEVGLYSAASKLVVFLLLFDRVLGVMLLPASVRVHASSPDQLSLRLEEALKWILITALPICVGGMLVSRDIIRLVFGENFALAAELFQILIWFLCFTMIHTVFTTGLVAVAPTKIYGRVMMISAVVYLGTIVIFTRLFGLYGTVSAVVFSEGATLLLARVSLRPYLHIRPNIPVLRIAFALVIVVVGVTVVHQFNVLIRVMFGAFVYCSVLALFKVFTLNEVAALVWRKSS